MSIKFPFHIIFLVSSFLGISQNNPADSLINVLKKTGDDTNRVNLLNQISNEFKDQTDFDNAKAYALQALNLSEKLNFEKGRALTYKILGNIYFEEGDYPKAIEFYFSTLKIREHTNDSVGIAAILTNIGNTYNNQSDYLKALENYSKAIAIYEKVKMQKSPQYFNVLNGLGNAYESRKEFDKALEYYLRSKEISELINDEDALAISLNNIGNVYKDYKKKYDEALDYYFKSLKIRERIGDQYGVSTTLNNIGAIYHVQKKNSQALLYASKGLSIAKEIETLELEKDAELLLSEVYNDLGDKASAFLHFKSFVNIRDSLFSAEKIKNIAQQESKMKEEKMEENFKEEQIKKEAELKQQKIISYSFTFGFALVLVLIFVVFRSLKQTREKNKIIESQKKEVEHKNALVEHKQKEILDSITYAQRIQHALLASADMLNKNLHEHFVLFKPKDIVSGDFYWATKTENAFYLITADSTGHGVPGAFMSLLNISFLNEAINEKKLKEPGKVLNHVRENLIKALRTDGSEDRGKDGMDCTLCAFDFTNNTLQYAAANNSFYIVRNKELLVFSADKMPVGKSPRDQEQFTTHTIQLEKGDVVYTLTDGYPDQFGGPKGKKFKYKPLEEILLQNSDKRMVPQRDILQQRLVEWMGELEQVDDVLLIGIRV